MNTTQILVASPIGSFVKYKGEVHMIIDFNDDMSLMKIINPVKGNGKLMVSPSKLDMLMVDEAVCIRHEMARYLVTKKGTIVSMTTGRVMQWDDNNGNRKAILAAA